MKKVAGEIELSVVIPIYNEEQSIIPIYERLLRVLGQYGKDYEIIFVDDGSSDSSARILKELYLKDARLKVIRFRRNFGQTAALSAGFNHARGKIIITLDGDEQNYPEDIPALLAKMGEGYDVVSGWRKDRKDSLVFRRLPSMIANLMIGLFTGIKLNDFGCTLKAYKSEIIKHIELYGEMHRMIPVLASWMGATITEIEVRHDPRKHGKSKYSMGRTLSVILDLITLKFFLGYFTRPLHFFGLLGLFLNMLGVASGITVIMMKYTINFNMTGNPFLILAVLLIIVGVQLIVMGLLGEIIIRTYFESQKKPIYITREVLEHSE